MRNLQLIDCSVISDVDLVGCQLLTVDCDVKLIYCINKMCIITLDLFSNKITHQLPLNDLVSNDSSPICIQHLFDRMAVFVAMSNGDILLWNTAGNEIECVGCVENGIKCASWSPDMDILALYTGSNQLVLMSRELDPLIEVDANPAGSGEAQMITVGWGKKETQFHGSQGKAAALGKTNVPQSRILQFDDCKPRISWRGDGQYLVVSSVNPESGERELRVWTREGVLHSVCESKESIGQTVSYRPSGSVIVSAVFRDTHYSVICYEKNGLRKDNVDFKLSTMSDEGSFKVVEVMWNLESSVLALWLEELSAQVGAQPKAYVELWTMNNYHWYMKQRIYFEMSKGKVNTVVWDPVDSLRLHVLYESGHYATYTWTWTTIHSTGQTTDDMTTVAVIDSDRVLITPFRSMVVPPPMSAFYLQMMKPVQFVAYCSSSDHSNDIAVLLADRSLVFYIYSAGTGIESDDTVKLSAAGGNGFKLRCPLPRLHSTMRLEGDESCIITHLHWINENELIYCKSVDSQTSVCAAHINWNSSEIVARVSAVVPTDVTVISVVHNAETGNTVLQMSSGQILQFNAESGVLQSWKTASGAELRMPVICQKLVLSSMNKEEVVLGLTDRFRFYIDCVEVASNCTSFAVHDEFLLLTTHSHTCRCISRQTPPTEVSKLLSSTALSDETVRQIERGACIVCAVPTDTKVVLQMPRGNLEVIHPRSLVLSAIRRSLDRLKFFEAFQLVKKNRINMNLLYDHNPVCFLANTDTFVTQLDQPVNINLFLTDLQKEDVTETLYASAYKGTCRQAVPPSKVDIVCNAVEQALERVNPGKYVLSILTAYVKKSVPQLELALQRIQSLKANPRGDVTPDEALRYLLYLVDVNDLYNVALGTYDFTLVLMVAEKSQKDPKEYLPQLNELQKLDQNYQRYRIDVQLRRFDRAVQHIIKCGSERFNECLTFIKDNRLYTQALGTYCVNSSEYLEVSGLYGEYLLENQRYSEAGLILSRVGQLERALFAFESCLDWKLAVVTAGQLHYNGQKMQQLARQLAKKLIEVRKCIDASCLLEQYADDFEEAIVTLINGCQWQEALRLIYKYQRPDFIETNLKPAILEACDQQLSLMNNTHADFEKYTTRLKIVREENLLKVADLYDCGGDGAVNNDLYSDTSSVTDGDSSSVRSLGSRRSKVSSSHTNKSRQKRERKRFSLKEGSPNEHLALVAELHKIVVQADQWKEDVSSVVRVLILFNFDKETTQLQNQLSVLLKRIDECFAEIWQPTVKQHSSLGPDSTVNSILKERQQTSSKSTHEESEKQSNTLPPVVRHELLWRLPIFDDLNTV